MREKLESHSETLLHWKAREIHGKTVILDRYVDFILFMGANVNMIYCFVSNELISAVADHRQPIA